MAQILVVDDEMGIRELLSEILEDEGHAVLLAESAGAARSMREAKRPDLVLLDIWMPDSDGITLLTEWASSGQLTMPVVMMSGHGTIETAVEATRIGALDYLEKPIALQRLLSTVKRALRDHDLTAPRPLSLTALGRSASLVELRKRLAQLAQTAAPLMLRGEPGMLPEIFARQRTNLLQPKTDVLRHGEVGKKRRLLINTGDAELMCPGGGQMRHVPAVDGNAAAIGLVCTGDDLDQCGFARTILTEQRMHLPRPQVERHPPERVHRAEGFGDRRQIKKGSH
jgi:DNA-binding response OmpR family regulator